jgi:hypothetical protein
MNYLTNNFLVLTSSLWKKREFFLTLLIIFPLFLSWSLVGTFGLDRAGGVSSDYFITLPLSLFVSLFFILRYAIKLVHSREVLFLSVWLVFGGVVKYAYNLGVDYSYIKIALEMLLFVILIKSFELYWLNRLHCAGFSSSKYNVFIKPFAVIIFLLFIGSIYLDRGSIIINSIKIYNYEQYYALSVILFLMVVLSKGVSKLFSLFVICFSIYLAKDSYNTTALIAIFFCFIYYFSHVCLPHKFNKCLYTTTLLFLVVFFVLIYPTVLLLLDLNGALNSRSLIKRASMMQYYFQSLESYQLIFPFLSDIRSVKAGMHNELLEVFYTTGIIGVVFYYYLIIKRLLMFNPEFRLVGIAIAVVVFIGGATVVPTLHPYLMVILAYIISYYYVLSINMSKQEYKV